MLGARKRTPHQSIERLQKMAKRAMAAKQSILSKLCYKIDQVRKQRQNCISYGFVSKLVAESKLYLLGSPGIVNNINYHHYYYYCFHQ